MIKHNYDAKIKAAYVYLETVDKVGSLEVKGNIVYRKPSSVRELDGSVILDFNEAGELVGIEILGAAIPQSLRERELTDDEKEMITPPDSGYRREMGF